MPLPLPRVDRTKDRGDQQRPTGTKSGGGGVREWKDDLGTIPLRHPSSAEQSSAQIEEWLALNTAMSQKLNEAMDASAARWVAGDEAEADRREALARLSGEVEVICQEISIANHRRGPSRLWAIQQVTESLQTVWPRARTKVFGSYATGLSLPSSDIDLLVCLPTVRNLEPIEEAGILEGHKSIEESSRHQLWLREAARAIANQSWLVPDSLKTIEGTKIPIITMRVRAPTSGLRQTPEGDGGEESGYTEIPMDISFEAEDNQGLETVSLVRQLVARFPMLTPLTLFLKQLLHSHHLDRAYTGGLSPYCLLLLVTRFLQHPRNQAEAERPQRASLGQLLLDFLHFFGHVFDPRTMIISTELYKVGEMHSGGSRWRSEVDPLYVEDPLNPLNNVGQSVFRIYQVQKSFGEASLDLERSIGRSPPGVDAPQATGSTVEVDGLLERMLLSSGADEGEGGALRQAPIGAQPEPETEAEPERDQAQTGCAEPEPETKVPEAAPEPEPEPEPAAEQKVEAHQAGRARTPTL